MAQKKEETVKITFNPLYSAAQQKTVLLRTKQVRRYGDTLKDMYVPTIDGLPMTFTVKKGEIKEITIEQFKKLYELGLIETPEDIELRKKQMKNIPVQRGIDPQVKTTAELNDIYKDKFVQVV